MIGLWPVQAAVYTALSASPATYPTYDAVPQGAAYPYFVIGEFTGSPDEEVSVESVDASLNLHTWSRGSGKKEILEMQEFARARLDNQDIGGGAWACSEDFVEVFEDRSSTASNRLYHGVQRFRIRAN